MKVQDLIKKLQELEKNGYGEFNVKMGVNDSFSSCFNFATLLNVDSAINKDLKQITLSSSLDKVVHECLKVPKITYRKAIK